MSAIASLSAFKAEARRLGATLTEHDNAAFGDKPSAFRVWESAPSGGCGLRGCRCSPGLWVSAAEGTVVVSAHFGMDTERGGDGLSGEVDFDHWRSLKAACEERDARVAA